jgi:WD40 repeat protein
MPSPLSRLLAVCFLAASLLAAEARSGKPTAPSARLTGHTERGMALAISLDGRWLLSGSQDRTLRLWGLHSRQELGRLDGKTGLVRSVDFSHDDGPHLGIGQRA